MLSAAGNELLHNHTPCERCGFATRYKQWPIRCRCNQHSAEWKRMMARACVTRVVEPIWAEQEQKNAALPVPTGPPLALAPRYANGKP